MEMLEGLGLVAGGGAASFAGAFAAIRVHIQYLSRDAKAQNERIIALELSQYQNQRDIDRLDAKLETLKEHYA